MSETLIANTWFPKHQANIETHGDLTVLIWKEPGTNLYHIRYVFDGKRLYITGDLGSAIFQFGEEISPLIVANYSFDRFYEKLVVTSKDKVDFDSNQAVQRLKEWIEENVNPSYDADQMDEFIQSAKECSTKESWLHLIHEYEGFLTEIDEYNCEWVEEIGDTIPIYVEGFLVGMKMAAKQLNKAEII